MLHPLVWKLYTAFLLLLFDTCRPDGAGGAVDDQLMYQQALQQQAAMHASTTVRSTAAGSCSGICGASVASCSWVPQLAHVVGT